MNTRKYIHIGIVLLIVSLGLMLYFISSQMEAERQRTHGSENSHAMTGTMSGHQSSNTTAHTGNPVTDFIAAYRTAIEFYGRVEDQDGEPVAGATVKLCPFDSTGEDSRSKTTVQSDAGGKFSVKGLKGLALGVQVTKEGYLTMPDLGFEKPASSRRIEYRLDGSGGQRFKDAAHPTIFTLHKVGPVEPLVYVAEKRWKLAVDGTSRKIALDTEDGTGNHQIDFRFTSDRNKLPNDNDSVYKRFAWKFEASIPGGGFSKIGSDYEFEAPDAGYQERISIEFAANLTKEQWKRTAYGRFFVKFRDGSYGRIRIGIDGASDRRPLSMTTWLGMKAGSRNLASSHKDNFGLPAERGAWY